MELTPREFSLILQSLAFFARELTEMSREDPTRYLDMLERIDGITKKLREVRLIAEEE